MNVNRPKTTKVLVKPSGASAAIRRSVAKAKTKVENATLGFTKFFAMVEKARVSTKEDITALDVVAVDEGIFASLRKWGAKGIIESEPFRQRIRQRMLESLDSLDGNFLIRLGRALKQKEPNPASYENLDLVLTGAWLPGRGKGRFGLCDCTDKAITEFCCLFSQQ